MSVLLFPDNTVLINFALARRFDLLELLVHGRGRWTSFVARECLASSRFRGLEELRRAPAVFGEPLFLTSPRDFVDAALVRERLGHPTDPLDKHLGEAEALVILSRHAPPGVFVTDDRAARREAERWGVRTYSTCDLIRLAVRARIIEASEAWAMVDALRRAGRALGDSPQHRDDYLRWCWAA